MTQHESFGQRLKDTVTGVLARRRHHPTPTPTPAPSPGGATVAWINESGGSLSNSDTARIVEALNLQAPAVATAWKLTPSSHVVATVHAVPTGAVKAYFLPSADVANALGYHAVDPQGDPYIRVFVDTILQNGGTALTGPVSVSVCAAHEAAEEAVDPQCASYSQPESNGNEVAIEVGDPVENNSYQVALADGTHVDVTDFAFPSFFDPKGAAPYDQLGLVTSPFELLKGGYEIVKAPSGKVTQVFGQEYPEWRNTTRLSLGAEASRTARRLRLST
jgi:hypothetical protein